MRANGCAFSQDLRNYLSQYTRGDNAIPQLVPFVATLTNYDMRTARVSLVASVPGRHGAKQASLYGHLRMRELLSSLSLSPELQRAPVVAQFSSMGSLNGKWLDQFTQSLAAHRQRGPTAPAALQLVWPTVADVRDSTEGWKAGGSIPLSHRNCDALMNILRKQPERNLLHRWDAEYRGRHRAMPHIKTYTRAHGEQLAWALLTSSNLSQAAWGNMDSSGRLFIRHWELGVLFWPGAWEQEEAGAEQGAPFEVEAAEAEDTVQFKLAPPAGHVAAAVPGVHQTAAREQGFGPRAVLVPLPHNVHPEPYAGGDEPWVWDVPRAEPDSHGYSKK